MGCWGLTGIGFRVKDLKLMGKGLGLKGLGFRAWGLGYKVSWLLGYGFLIAHSGFGLELLVLSG